MNNYLTTRPIWHFCTFPAHVETREISPFEIVKFPAVQFPTAGATFVKRTGNEDPRDEK